MIKQLSKAAEENLRLEWERLNTKYRKQGLPEVPLHHLRSEYVEELHRVRYCPHCQKLLSSHLPYTRERYIGQREAAARVYDEKTTTPKLNRIRRQLKRDIRRGYREIVDKQGNVVKDYSASEWQKMLLVEVNRILESRPN